MKPLYLSFAFKNRYVKSALNSQRERGLHLVLLSEALGDSHANGQYNQEENDKEEHAHVHDHVLELVAHHLEVVHLQVVRLRVFLEEDGLDDCLGGEDLEGGQFLELRNVVENVSRELEVPTQGEGLAYRRGMWSMS